MVPGETYGEGDVPLFERVASAVDSDLGSARAARNIVTELRYARSRSEPPEAILLRVTDDLPSLRFLVPAFCSRRTTPAHRVQMARAVGMLVTIVGARMRGFETEPTDTTRAR